jgi:hypothetical protein
MENREVITGVLVLVLALGCETTSHAPAERPSEPTAVPTMPIPVIETHEVIEPPPPSFDEDDLVEEAEAADDAVHAPASGAREIHPHGGMADCLEMYSACSPDPATPGAQRCTSAPLLLACGQTGTIPGGDTLICVCP